jgi:hypothetical protein
MSGLKMNRLVACVAASSLFLSSTAAVASAPVARAPAVQQIDPWAALSALSGAAPAAALCGAAAAAAALQPAPGCVLPVVDAAPVVAQSAPPPPTPVPPVEPVGGGFGIDPLLLGLGALVVGALIYFLVIKKKDKDDDDDDDVSPS